jgi:hypothetical protein
MLVLYVVATGPGKVAVQLDPHSAYTIPVLALMAFWT